MSIEELVNRAYTTWAHDLGTSWTAHMRAALTEQAAEHDRKQALLLEAHCERVGSLQERIREIESQRVPDGWKLVPVEPTQEMLKKSGLYDDDTIEVNCAASMAGQIYRAMLAAAPAAPAPAPVILASRCPVCFYQHGHQIGCENNPIDIALRASAPAPKKGVE